MRAIGSMVTVSEPSIDVKPEPVSKRSVVRDKSSGKTDINNEKDQQKPYKMEIVWRNVTVFAVLHILGLYGLYLHVTRAKLLSMIYFWCCEVFGAVGITAGAHRLWSHRAYKARLPMRILLMLMQSAAHQNSIYEWARDHRAHHKFTDTDGDPHNATRGFFFSHMGWLVVKKHPELQKRGAGIDMSDLANDPVVAFQRRYFYVIMPMMCFIIPTLIPIYLWGEDVKVAIFTTLFRYQLSLHLTWLVNSAAHLWGNKPYDKFISSAENVAVAFAAQGEGWHNYHHVFPWDYKAAELGNYGLNWTTGFIDFFAKCGLAYDLKTVPVEMIIKRSEKTGDGSSGATPKPATDVWGWDDADMTQEDKQATTILGKTD